MPRKTQKTPGAAQAYDPAYDLTPPSTPDDSPTVGELGLTLEPYLPGFAVMADDPDELTEPGKPPHRPGEEKEPEPPVEIQPVTDEPEEDDEDEDDSFTDPEPLPGEVPPDKPDPAKPPYIPPPVDSQEDLDAINAQRRRVYEAQRVRSGLPPKTYTATITPADEDFSLPSGAVTYTARIQIVDAWSYPGNFVNAPEWVDRNWLGYGDEDQLRGIPSGPCLRVPSHADSSAVTLCRIGDYVARQSVTLDDGPVEMRTEVWNRDQFRRLFIAKPVTQAKRKRAA